MVLLVRESGGNLEEDSRLDQADSDRTFTLANIVPGNYLLMAIGDGWDCDWRNPAVLKPYRERAQLIPVSPDQAQKITLAVQPTLNSTPDQVRP
jgi:hypothetical protein